MNKDIIQGHWHELKGKLKSKWGSLTEDEIAQINGKKEQLLGKLQQKYGWTKEKAETELKNFLSQFPWAREEEAFTQTRSTSFSQESRSGEQKGSTRGSFQETDYNRSGRESSFESPKGEGQGKQGKQGQFRSQNPEKGSQGGQKGPQNKNR